MSWKGGAKPTGLGSGNDGFTNVPDRKPSFKAPTDLTIQTGREVTVDVGGSVDNGGGRRKGSQQSYAD